MQLLAERFGAHRVTVHSGSRKSKTHEMSLADYAKWWAGRGGGSDGKDDTMCYYLEGVPGVDGKLTECFALVLMFNPRIGARWPARFEQGNTYWAEIIAGR